jgi:hypothetical protein
MMTVDFAWAFAGGGADPSLADNVRDLALDGAGNVYAVGKFVGTVDFDPGPGLYQLTSNPADARSNFVAKYDASGSLLWAQQFGGNANDSGDRELAVDGAGNVLIAGSFTGSADFGSTTLTSQGTSDAFLTKLDASGSFLWAKQFGGAAGNGVAVDGNGNALIVGELRVASTGPDAFVAKVAPNGSTLWSINVGASNSSKGKTSTTNYAGGQNIAVDAAGNIYATGYMLGTVDFDAGSGTTALEGLSFVMKLSSGGSLAWARTLSNKSLPYDARVWSRDIAVGANGNVYSTGWYWGSVDFDPGLQKTQKFVLNSGGGHYSAAYVTALNSNGDFLWAKSTQSVAGAEYRATPEAIALDGTGAIYVAGALSNTADFDPGASAFNLTPAGSFDAFVWKLDTSGNFLWAGQMGGAGTDEGRAIAVNGTGDIFVAGDFTDTADFDPGPGTYNLTSAGGYDFFVARLTQPAAAAALQSQLTGLAAPNNSSSSTNAASTDRAFALLSKHELSRWSLQQNGKLLSMLLEN